MLELKIKLRIYKKNKNKKIKPNCYQQSRQTVGHTPFSGKIKFFLLVFSYENIGEPEVKVFKLYFIGLKNLASN